MVKQGVELTELHLKENSLGIPTREDRAGSSGLVALCGALSDCRRLRLIDMSDNDLSNGDSGKAFAGLLRQFPAEQLSELHLSRCRLGDRNATPGGTANHRTFNELAEFRDVDTCLFRGDAEPILLGIDEPLRQ